MAINLYDHQKDALKRMKNGCILCGGVGSGKSITSLAYYHQLCGGYLNPFKKMTKPVDLYIITTAKKRDEGEWDKELIPFLLSSGNKDYDISVVIDSWNNIKKYIDVKNSFFIFDEQRVIGSGSWVKSFYKITKKNQNQWILLSATPGDCWMDYVPVFVANGFYKNKTEFNTEHVIYSYYTSYPQIDRYINTQRLNRLRRSILVEMDFQRHTIPHHIDIFADYDFMQYNWITKNRFSKEKNEPIETASELCYELRKLVNSDPSRLEKLIDIVNEKKKVIIFYNYDYELNLIKYLFEDSDYEVKEWNGHKHQEIPKSDWWIYLVQYNAGAEGWNCIRTDTIVFYSQTYSYKMLEQASGRINRINTPYTDLYYYHLKSRSKIDLAIARALKAKKKFNESRFVSNEQI